MIILKDINYKIRDLHKNNSKYFYLEYIDWFATSLRVFTAEDIKNIEIYNYIIEKDTFEDNHIIHHDFRLINSILFSLKTKNIEAQAFKIEDGWKIYKKVSNWIPFISNEKYKDFWLSPCQNFYIEKDIIERKNNNEIRFNIKVIGVDNRDIGFWSNDLDYVLDEYNKPELHIQAMYFTKNYSKYSDKLKEVLVNNYGSI